MRAYLVLPVLLALLSSCSESSDSRQTDASPSEPASVMKETEAQRAERMAWWEDARFGMFIHWGLYAVPAGEYRGQRVDGIGEWIMNSLQIPIAEYEQFATEFNPTQYDPEAWVQLAKAAGMKYIVITSKHHDGFALWDSKVSDYDVVDRSPYGQDLIKPLAEACEKAGIRLCFYHSIMDWHHPDAQAIWEPDYQRDGNDEEVNPNFQRYLDTYMKPQLEELLTHYGDIGVLWFDGEWIPDYTTDMGKEVYSYVRGLKPDIIINNRVDKGRRGMQGMTRDGDYLGDFGTPEQEIPDTGLPGVYWESCMTMNDTWGYKSFDDNWKSDTTLIRNLVDIVSKGGNFLLNVGPTAAGEIPQPSVERLQAMGAWMELNGESIHGAAASPYPMPEWGRYTSKDGKLYVHVFDWPADGQLSLPAGKSSKARLLATGEALNLTTDESGERVIRLPANAPDPIASVIVLE